MREIEGLLRDFVNAKGTRYTKMADRVGRNKDGIWFCLARDGINWVVGFVDEEKGIETKFTIFKGNDSRPLNAFQAYRVAVRTYRAFVLGDEEAKQHFEVSSITELDDTPPTRH